LTAAVVSTLTDERTWCARYKALGKNTLDLRRTAAVVNLQRSARLAVAA